MILLNGLTLFIFIILSCIVHEIGHILAIKIFGYNIYEFKLTLVGGKILSYDLQKARDIQLVVIYILGIVFNVILGIVCYEIGMRGYFSHNFFLISGINYLLAIFNLMPIKTLDGYNFLYHLMLSLGVSIKKCNLFCNIISIFCNISLFIVGIFYIKLLNFSLIVISVFLFISNYKRGSYKTYI